MDVLVERCAGLDVHRDTMAATVRIPVGLENAMQRLDLCTIRVKMGTSHRVINFIAGGQLN